MSNNTTTQSSSSTEVSPIPKHTWQFARHTSGAVAFRENSGDDSDLGWSEIDFKNTPFDPKIDGSHRDLEDGLADSLLQKRVSMMHRTKALLETAVKLAESKTQSQRGHPASRKSKSAREARFESELPEIEKHGDECEEFIHASRPAFHHLLQRISDWSKSTLETQKESLSSQAPGNREQSIKLQFQNCESNRLLAKILLNRAVFSLLSQDPWDERRQSMETLLEQYAEKYAKNQLMVESLQVAMGRENGSASEVTALSSAHLDACLPSIGFKFHKGSRGPGITAMRTDLGLQGQRPLLNSSQYPWYSSAKTTPNEIDASTIVQEIAIESLGLNCQLNFLSDFHRYLKRQHDKMDLGGAIKQLEQNKQKEIKRMGTKLEYSDPTDLIDMSRSSAILQDTRQEFHDFIGTTWNALSIKVNGAIQDLKERVRVLRTEELLENATDEDDRKWSDYVSQWESVAAEAMKVKLDKAEYWFYELSASNSDGTEEHEQNLAQSKLAKENAKRGEANLKGMRSKLKAQRDALQLEKNPETIQELGVAMALANEDEWCDAASHQSEDERQMIPTSPIPKLVIHESPELRTPDRGSRQRNDSVTSNASLSPTSVRSLSPTLTRCGSAPLSPIDQSVTEEEIGQRVPLGDTALKKGASRSFFDDFIFEENRKRRPSAEEATFSITDGSGRDYDQRGVMSENDDEEWYSDRPLSVDLGDLRRKLAQDCEIA